MRPRARLTVALVVLVGLALNAKTSKASRELQQMPMPLRSAGFSMATALNMSRSLVARYNVSAADALSTDVADLLLAIASGEALSVLLRIQLDNLYAGMAYTEAASNYLAQPGVNDDIHIVPAAGVNDVTPSLLFRSNEFFTGRGDVWIADATTGPCEGGDCRLGAAEMYDDNSTAAAAVTIDDLQGLPTVWAADVEPPVFMPAGPADVARPQLLMYYRHDLFASGALGPPPASWNDLADWAAAVNGTVDADGDGHGDWALCVDTTACKASFVMMAVMASTVQLNTTTGTFITPLNGTVLAGSEGFRESLRVMSRLAQYSVPTPSEPHACRAYDPAFFAGRCLVTISFDQMRVSAGPARDHLPPGALGVAPLPGTESMLHRGSGELRACRPPANCTNAVATTCAAGPGDFVMRRKCVVNRAPLLAKLSYDTAMPPNSAPATIAHLATLARGAALATSAWPAALASTLLPGAPPPSSSAAARAAYDDDSAAAAAGRRLLAAAAAEGSPRRRRLHQEAAAAAAAAVRNVTVADWTTAAPLTQLGYSEVEASRYLAVYWANLAGQGRGSNPGDATGPHRNVVEELSIRGSSFFTSVYGEACAAVILHNVSVAAASRRALNMTELLMGLAAANRTRLVYQYCLDIGWTPKYWAGYYAVAAAPAHGGSGLSSGQLAAAIAAPVVGVLLAVALVVAAAVLVLRRRGLSAFGTLAPPGASPRTTLLLTDIQNSTVLWETLNPATMDRAIRVHHQVLRSLLPQHRGYESATEGDAFLLSFHTAENAAQYAVAAQVLLVEAAWPNEMLGHPDCELVWVQPQRSAPTAALSYISKELLAAITRAVQTGAAPLRLRQDGEEEEGGKGKGKGKGKRAGGGGGGDGGDGGLAALLRRVRGSSGGRALPYGSDVGKGGDGGGGGAKGGSGGGADAPMESSDSGDLPALSETNENGSGNAAAFNNRGRQPDLFRSRSKLNAGDIRCYMEAEWDVDVPLPPGLRALDVPPTPSGGPPSTARAHQLHHAPSTGLHSGASSGMFGLGSPSASVGAVAPSDSLRPGQHVALNTSVATVAEALRQGWRRVPAASALQGGGGGGGGGVVDGGSERGGSGTGEAEQRLLAFRGMRVRMGLHTGADASEVSPNKATGRTQYSGTFMTLARAVCDSAHGGQIVVSPATFKQLPPGGLAKRAFLIHMGEHQLALGEAAAAAARDADADGGDEDAPEALYQLLPYSLACRLPFFEPLRTKSYMSLGMPDAPVGRVTVVFMYVIGAQTLLSWNPAVAGAALGRFQATVEEQLNAADGYVVELVDGLCLAAFRSAADALLWSLRCGRLLLEAPWSEELLEHELCEEVTLPMYLEWATGSTPAPAPAPAPAPLTVLTDFDAPSAGTPFTNALSSRPSTAPGPSHSVASLDRPPSPPAAAPPPQSAPARVAAMRYKTLMRGLRLKVGMDTGFVADSINASTGRVAYRGRPMNRAARIASKAAAGQVHCSAAVWGAAVERLAVVARAGGEDELSATSLGLQSLKGVMEKIEVLSVAFKGGALSAEEAEVMAKRAPRRSHGSAFASSNGASLLGFGGSAFSAAATQQSQQSQQPFGASRGSLYAQGAGGASTCVTAAPSSVALSLTLGGPAGSLGANERLSPVRASPGRASSPLPHARGSLSAAGRTTADGAVDGGGGGGGGVGSLRSASQAGGTMTGPPGSIASDDGLLDTAPDASSPPPPLAASPTGAPASPADPGSRVPSVRAGAGGFGGAGSAAAAVAAIALNRKNSSARGGGGSASSRGSPRAGGGGASLPGHHHHSASADHRNAVMHVNPLHALDGLHGLAGGGAAAASAAGDADGDWPSCGASLPRSSMDTTDCEPFELRRPEEGPFAAAVGATAPAALMDPYSGGSAGSRGAAVPASYARAPAAEVGQGLLPMPPAAPPRR